MQIYAINTNKQAAKIWKQFVTQKSLCHWVCVCVWVCREKQNESQNQSINDKCREEKNGMEWKKTRKSRPVGLASTLQLQMIMKMPSQTSPSGPVVEEGVVGEVGAKIKVTEN